MTFLKDARSRLLSSDSSLSSVPDPGELGSSAFEAKESTKDVSAEGGASLRKTRSSAQADVSTTAEQRLEDAITTTTGIQSQGAKQSDGDAIQGGRRKRLRRQSEGANCGNAATVKTESAARRPVETISKTGPSASRTKRRSARAKTESLKPEQDLQEADEGLDEEKANKKRRRGKTTTTKAEVDEYGQEEAEAEAEHKPKRRRKTKEEQDAEAMPLAARSTGLKMFIGAHVSSAKGVHNSIPNSIHIGANAFALFLKSQRKWANPDLNPEHAIQFKSFCRDHSYDAASHVLPHGSYLVNLAQPDPDRATQAYACFLDDLQRCDALGIRLYNFHPGSKGPHPREDAIGRIANALNRAHKATKHVKTVLETMAGSESVIGSTFEDIRDIVAGVQDKSRVGVCLDTCHVFAAGYDLRTKAAYAETMARFNSVIGLRYLSALHLNDSKAPFSSHRDLHQNIGLGFLGLRAFHHVVNDRRLEGLPLVLETPIDRDGKEEKGIWAAEIKLLERMIGQDPDSPAFLAKEKGLADQGAQERLKLQEAFDRKQQKTKEKKKKKKAEAPKKRRKAKKDESSSGGGAGSTDDGEG